MDVETRGNALLETLRNADYIVAKAVRVREVSRIARLETLLRQFITREWDILSKQATDNALRRLRRSGEKLTDRDINAIVSEIDKVMLKWSKRVRARFNDDTEDIYMLAREAGHRKATGQISGSLQYNTKPFSAKPKDIAERAAQNPVPQVTRKQVELLPDFSLIDTAAVGAMQADNTFWIGAHYGSKVQKEVRRVTREKIIEQGRDRAKAGAVLRGVVASQLKKVVIPGGFTGTHKQYFEGLVANTATVARVQGQLTSFEKAEFVSYVIVNPIDERTCVVCGHMDGKLFTVEQGRNTMDAEIAAEDPTAVRKVHPWLNEKKLKAISPKAGPVGKEDRDALAKAGFNLPPFHFRCRCTVDIA